MKEKRRVCIFGAGQAGAMVKNWIPAGNELIYFIDNNGVRHGKEFCGVKIVSVEEACNSNPDLIWIAVLRRESQIDIKKQLRNMGYNGEVRSVSEIRDLVDLRVSALRLLADSINGRNVPGYVAELGVYKGDFAAEINRAFPQRKLFLFDTFSGFDPKDLKIEMEISGRVDDRDFCDTNERIVIDKLMYPEQAVIVRGAFPESLKNLNDSPEMKFAFVSLDPDLYEPVKRGLEYFYPRLSQGGAIVVHDYNSVQYPNVRKAVDEYCARKKLIPLPLMDLHGSAVIVKQ